MSTDFLNLKLPLKTKMRGVTIFDERANMAFYSLDEEMEEFILGRMLELETEQSGAAAVSGAWVVTEC